MGVMQQCPHTFDHIVYKLKIQVWTVFATLVVTETLSIDR